jgi:hypothetical protein
MLLRLPSKKQIPRSPWRPRDDSTRIVGATLLIWT